MFAIGDEEWAGLSKLAEECGELIQVIGKLMGTRGKVDHWDGSHLGTWLEEEMGDVTAAMRFVARHNEGRIDTDAIRHRAMEKNDLFESWHQQGDPL